MRWRPRLNRHTERGASAVEFALTVPLLLLLLLGIVNFGYAYGERLALDNAAREAARVAVIDAAGLNCTGIKDKVSAHTGWLRTDPTITEIDGPGPCDQPCQGAGATSDVKVQLEYSSAPLVKLPLPKFGFPGFGTVTMESEGWFRCEYA